MADPQDKGAWTGILPSSYQKDIDLAKRKKLLAQVLMSGKQPTQGQMVSGYYVPPSMTQHLSNIFGQLYGTKMLLDSDEAETKALGRYNQDQQAELASILADASPREGRMAGDMGQASGNMDMADPPTQPTMIPGDLDKATTRAMGSQFPLARDLGKELAKQQEKVFSAAAPTSDTQSIISSQGRVGGLRPRQPQWETKDAPGVGTFALSTDVRGGQHVAGIQKPVVPPEVSFGEDVAKVRLADLQKQYEPAKKLSDLQQAIVQAHRVLASGALNTGAYADKVTEIQALAKFLNEPVPQGVPATQYFRNVILPQLTETLRGVNPVGASSNLELQTALARALTNEQDPRAIQALLAKSLQVSQKGLTMYNKQVQGLLDWAKINRPGAMALIEPLQVPGGIGRTGPNGEYDPTSGLTEEEFKALFGDPAGLVTKPQEKPAGGQRKPRQSITRRNWADPDPPEGSR